MRFNEYALVQDNDAATVELLKLKCSNVHSNNFMVCGLRSGRMIPLVTRYFNYVCARGKAMTWAIIAYRMYGCSATR